jgi:hypothetical protein
VREDTFELEGSKNDIKKVLEFSLKLMKRGWDLFPVSHLLQEMLFTILSSLDQKRHP